MKESGLASEQLTADCTCKNVTELQQWCAQLEKGLLQKGDRICLNVFENTSFFASGTYTSICTSRVHV